MMIDYAREMMVKNPYMVNMDHFSICSFCFIMLCKLRHVLDSDWFQAVGQYSVHYRNAFHAFWTIARNDGLVALQSGLVPALYYQFFMNGMRLGIYQVSVGQIEKLILLFLLLS